MDEAARTIARLTAGLTGQYTVNRQVGLGGMATVFEAIDLQHDRRVAMKVLRPEIGAMLGGERFTREIRIAANLSHPHILPVYGSGEVDGLLYYTMPFVDGESLRERLTRDGQLPIEESLQIGREVSQALTHAHARGVVHRDLKPENIMLSGGVAVVMDFGIAYAAAFAGGEQLTATGLAIGTPAYMSPEQAAGERGIDHRSDVYSLGCVLYEMLAGRPPFQGGSAFAVLSQLATQEAPDLRGLRPDVPLPVALAIRTALAKDPANRFGSVADLLAACDGATGPVRRLSTTPRLRRRTQLILGGAIALIVAGGLWLGFLGGSTGSMGPNQVVAVLPFEHIGPEDEAYVTQGIGNEVSNSISGIGGISVISRASAVQFDRNTPLSVVRRELNADFVVRGSVQTNRQADGETQVRLSTQLISVEDGQELYSDTLTATLNSGILFTIQQQIARRVADALALTLRPQTLGALRGGQTTNPEAYRAYLQGSIHAAQFLVPTEQLKAIQYFTQATTIDPGFALAWARLAQLEAVFYALYDRTPARLARVERAVAQADSLRPGDAETAIARGYQAAFSERGGRDRAMAEFASVRKELPNSIELLWAMGSVYRARGDVDSAFASFSEAARLDPRSPVIVFEEAVTAFLQRRYEEAEALLARARALAPEWPVAPLGLANVWFHAGDLDSARAAVTPLSEAAPALTPFLVGEPLYRPLWELVFPSAFQQALGALTLGNPLVDSAGYYYNKGRWHVRQGRAAAARPYFDSLRVLHRRRPAGAQPGFVVLVDLAAASIELGDTVAAIGYLDSLVVNDPIAEEAFRGSFALTEAARLLVRLGLHDRATALLSRLLAIPSPVSRSLLRVDPGFAPLTKEPGFRRLLPGPP